MPENQNKNVDEEELGETSKLFTEVSATTKNAIDTIKKELIAEEDNKTRLNPDYKKEKITISTVIDTVIDVYQTYKIISPKILEIIQKYTEEYGSGKNVIEEAVKLLERNRNPDELDQDLDLWCRSKEELGMMLIGKTTFMQMIAAAESPEDSLDKPIKRNIALDTILWYTGKQIRSLSLDEILNAIKVVWKAANYFYLIDVRKESSDQYHVIFKHYQNKRYSNYFLSYFKELFKSEDLMFKCLVEGEAFGETLSLTVKKLHDKDRIEIDKI